MAYIGRLQNGKNVDKVIELFESVAIEFPALELHIAGDGPLSEELTLKAMESLFSKRIFFHGYVEDIASFYESVDLFVFLSAHESFGNVLVEALLTGLPVLTSNVPAFEEIHGGEALFILGDPDEFLRVKEKFQKTIRAYPALAAVAYEKSHSLANRFGVEQHLTKIEPYYN